MSTFTAGQTAEITKAIDDAARKGIELEADNFAVNLDGDVTVDGMYPDEWLRALTMD